MIGWMRRAHATDKDGQGGFTLVELLVAITIFACLSTAVFSGLASAAATVNDVRSITNLTEEARVGTERITRELRQASVIYAAQPPAAGKTEYTSIKFGVDFNGDGILNLNAVDPEVVTYEFVPGSGHLTFIANDSSGSPVFLPILAENVTDFGLTFSSSLWKYDTNGDGKTTATEIDASALGNKNGVLDTVWEFDQIDSVRVTITLLSGARTQTYTTQVDLRNKNKN